MAKLNVPYKKHRINGRLNKFCVDCGEPISYGSKRCLLCYRKSQKGKKMSKEQKEKLSNIFKRQYLRGRIPSFLGKHRSNETKIKIGIANKGKPAVSSSFKGGKNHPNWQGGITSRNTKIKRSIEYRLWRESVFARDNYTCQKCSTRGGKALNSHHIFNFSEYPELRFAIDNGITFCEDCHGEFHKKFGKSKNNKKQLEQFLGRSIDL